ncbi:Two-pore potassium channel 2 [Sesamum alatum]|uniref:Two-pore potassium channel 2 n=1 Tax=Sesamum alatum TaxID=300844 RepID=A0AAE1Z1C5_9LAMI|nr:Two-pore potassium channel 2 [Sesamum alatum]
MAEDVEVLQDKPSNTCCAALKKKHSKLLEKYSKLEEIKNKFRDCTALVQQKYDVIEKENESLKKALAELNQQAIIWKDEKEKESGIRIDLEDEVSALKDEIQLLKQDSNSASQKADEQLQERLNVAEKEIKRLKELLEKEMERAASEKKNAELEKKKADEVLKKLEMGKKKVSEAQKVANVEKKKAEESRLLYEKLKKETDAVKLMLDSERSKLEAADKRAETEKRNAVRERERADLAVAKAKEQQEFAETNLKKAMFEKDRADDLNRKLEEMTNRAEKLEAELRSGKLAKAQADESNTGRNAELASSVGVRMLKNDVASSKRLEKLLLEKEQKIIREKKRADSEKKKAREQKKVAESQKTMAIEQKHRADQLSKELESYKLRFEELQKELQEFVSCRMYTDNSPVRHNNVISETDTIKLLKKRLKLEKMLVKHAKQASEVEAVRNSMLHQELCRLKQECLRFQQRLDILDDSFLHDSEGIHQLEKVGNQISTRETICSDGFHRQLISGIDTRLDPPCRGSNQKMLQSSAINSSSASYSDRHLVGSQERETFSVMTSAKLGEDISNLKPTISRLSDKKRIRYNEHAVALADNCMRSPINENTNDRRIGHGEKRRILDAVGSIENLYSKGEKLHRRVSKKLSLLHSILDHQKDEPEEGNVKENSCRKLVRPFKRRKTSCEGTMVVHRLQDSAEPKSMLNSNIDHPDLSCVHASAPRFDVMKSDQHIKDGPNDVLGSKPCIPQNFDAMAAIDYMKLLEMDNAAEEISYRKAIAMPLSPMLPEVDFNGDEKLEVNDSEMVVDESSQEELPNIRDNMASTSSFSTIDIEKNQTSFVFDGRVSSQLQTKEDSVDFLIDTNRVPVSDAHFHHVSGGKLRVSDLSGSGNEKTDIPCERKIASPPGSLLRYLVVSSDNKDNCSISRILQTIDSCMPLCSLLHSAKIFLQSILHTLSKSEDLSVKEKVCVFFSLILHGISEVGMKDSTKLLSADLVQSLDPMSLPIFSALSDPVLRRLFMESCDLSELLAVIEDFLLQKKVLACGDVSAESQVLPSSSINLVLNGNAIVLYEMMASAHLSVVGGSLLASVCLAVDRIGFLCEVSCNIIMMPTFDPAVLLAVLHVFAHICGSKYFTLQQYSIAMAVVKSLVMFLEKQTSSTNSVSSSPTVGNLSKSWLCCKNCPFSEGALPVEDVPLLLLQNLQNHDTSDYWPQDSIELVNTLVPRVWSDEERTEEVSALTKAVPLSTTACENLCDIIDILSLTEILVSFMSWDWTFEYVIRPICEYLESHLMEGFSAAIIILLGQLGSFGVGAGGYEDAGVKKLRERLSALACEVTFMKLSLSAQFAIVSSLFRLTPIKLEEIVEEKFETQAFIGQSFPAAFIKQWFSLLSSEQQSLVRLHLAASESNGLTGYLPREPPCERTSGDLPCLPTPPANLGILRQTIPPQPLFVAMEKEPLLVRLAPRRPQQPSPAPLPPSPLCPLPEHNEITIPPVPPTPSARELKDMLIFGSPSSPSAHLIDSSSSNLIEALTLSLNSPRPPLSNLATEWANVDEQRSNSDHENQQSWLIAPTYPRSKNLHRSKTAPAMATIYEIDRSSASKPPPPLFAKQSIVRQGVILLIMYLTLGVVIYSFNRQNFRAIETNSVVDALYFCIVTMCTIGYGDITPDSTATKLFSIAFVLVGFGFIDILLTGMVSYMLDLQENYLLKSIKGGGANDPGSYIIDVKKGRMRIRMKVGLALGVVVLCIGIGVFVMHFVERLNWLDSFYLSVMSVTTVGYGDRAFSTLPGRVFASLWLLVSTLAVARAFLYLTEARVDKRNRRMAKWVLSQNMTVAQFLAADIDNNGFVSKSEYVVYKLKEMGKVSEKDILQVCKQFERLDPGNCGKITLADLKESHNA